MMKNEFQDIRMNRKVCFYSPCVKIQIYILYIYSVSIQTIVIYLFSIYLFGGSPANSLQNKIQTLLIVVLMTMN